MRNRLAVLAAALTFVAGTAITGAAGEIVKSGVGWQADGKVVAKSADRIVVRTDDHGHRIAFEVDRDTAMPGNLAVGQHVHVVYHPLGSTGQAADKVELSAARTATR